MDFIHILGQKEAIWNTIFSIFERRRGPPNVAGLRKTFPFSPLSTGLFSGLFDYAHGYYSQHFSWAFVSIDPVNVPKK